MKHSEAIFAPESESQEHDVEAALTRAGLFDVEAPREGTKAYQRMIDAAESYIREVQRSERATPRPRGDSENYFAPQRRNSSSSSDLATLLHT